MGQVLHESATTTEAVRRAIPYSQESLGSLTRRYGINQKTVAKWKQCGSVADLPTGPKSTVFFLEDEATIVAFRRHMLLPLDDCLHALQANIPHLSEPVTSPRSSRSLPAPMVPGSTARRCSPMAAQSERECRWNKRPRAPLGRLGKHNDIAGAVSFLVGSNDGWTSGQTILADDEFMCGPISRTTR